MPADYSPVEDVLRELQQAAAVGNGCVGELIEQTLRQYLVSTTITVTLDIPETLPLVWVDSIQIQQVFRNLISNDVEATWWRVGTLAISAVENRQEGTVTVSVRHYPGGAGQAVSAVVHHQGVRYWAGGGKEPDPV